MQGNVVIENTSDECCGCKYYGGCSGKCTHPDNCFGGRRLKQTCCSEQKENNVKENKQKLKIDLNQAGNDPIIRAEWLELGTLVLSEDDDIYMVVRYGKASVYRFMNLTTAAGRCGDAIRGVLVSGTLNIER